MYLVNIKELLAKDIGALLKKRENEWDEKLYESELILKEIRSKQTKIKHKVNDLLEELAVLTEHELQEISALYFQKLLFKGEKTPVSAQYTTGVREFNEIKDSYNDAYSFVKSKSEKFEGVI